MAYVYLIGSKKFGWYKIGKANDPHIRVRQLGILLPFKVEVFAIWQTSQSLLVERLMHQKYAASAINGEWFSFSSIDIQNIIRDLQPFDSERIYRHGDSGEFALYSNINRDVPSKSDSVLDKKAFSKAFMEAVRKYLAEHNLELTKENKKLAKKEVWRNR